MNTKTSLLLLLSAFLLTSCVLLDCAIPAASASTPSFSGANLRIEEYLLIGEPLYESTTLNFADLPPDDRNRRIQGMEAWSFPVRCDEQISRDSRAWCERRDSGVWLALPDYTPDVMAVILTQNGEEIYRVPIGQPSPTVDIMGLWFWNDHWALETIYTSRQGQQIRMTGQISLDGTLLNARNRYEEAFGFQLLAGRPFFFLQRDGKVHIWYDGEEIELGYDEVPHYGCCSAATRNPYSLRNMVTFFARRGEQWYYTEIRPAEP